jgi:hypothetical protein
VRFREAPQRKLALALYGRDLNNARWGCSQVFFGLNSDDLAAIGRIHRAHPETHAELLGPQIAFTANPERTSHMRSNRIQEW